VTWVIKIGGSVRDPEPVLRDIAATVAASHEQIVVVHGASRALNDLSERLGYPPRIVESGRGDVSRYTDSTTMDHFLMAYAGVTNKRIVERLRQLGVDAFGLCGLDGGLATGRRRADIRIVANGRTRILHDNHAGSIERVQAPVLQTLLDRGCTPVVTPPIAAEDGTAINVDGDRLAAEVAIALHADRLFFFADTPGVLHDAGDQASSIREMTADNCDASSFSGRVRPKLQAAARAVMRGVDSVVIASGVTGAPLQQALRGEATHIVAASAANSSS